MTSNKIQNSKFKIPHIKYNDPILCPICGKVFGEWEEVRGVAVIKKWCSKCRKMVYVKKEEIEEKTI